MSSDLPSLLDTVKALDAEREDWQRKYSDPVRVWTKEDVKGRDDATDHRSAMYEHSAPRLALEVETMLKERAASLIDRLTDEVLNTMMTAHCGRRIILTPSEAKAMRDSLVKP